MGKSKHLTRKQLEALLVAKRAELASVAPAGSAWGGVQHDWHRATELSQEIRGIELALIGAK